MQINFEGKTKDEIATERIKTFVVGGIYHLAFSGGKDSVSLFNLTLDSSVWFKPVYQVTGVDPKEVIYFMRENYPLLTWAYPKITMWEGILIHGLPTRLNRWCCRELKETKAKETVLTGIRWAESVKRGKRQLVEACYKTKGKYFVNPIIDWTDNDVWEYINEHKLPVCKLYKEGFKRIGCIGCPQSSKQEDEFDRYPKIAKLYKRYAEKYLATHSNTKAGQSFNTLNEYWNWWLSDKSINDFTEDNPMFI